MKNTTQKTQGHTPGPWSATEILGQGTFTIYPVDHHGYVNGRTEAHIAVVGTAQKFDGESTHAADTFERREANARLIAAAPELLEVCKRVLLECPGVWNTCQTTGETFGFMLDAAIARSEGRG